MKLRRSKKKETFPFPGVRYALDGHAAAWAVESAVADALVVQKVVELAEITGPLRNLAPGAGETVGGHAPLVRTAESRPALEGLVAGFTASGLRTSAILADDAGLREALAASAGKRLSSVFHVSPRAPRRQGAPIQGGHDGYYAAADSGAFLLFATNPQEVADLALVAHRVAEQSLTPGICAHDLYRTTHAVQCLHLPEVELARRFLGRADDEIDAPTPSQRELFGARRRRVPLLVDADRPAGIGGSYDADSYFKAVAAQGLFFAAHTRDAAAAAMNEFHSLTGRRYAPLSEWRVDDADVVFVAQGAVVEELRAVADYLRRRDRAKVGVIGVTMFRPFPGAALSAALAGRKAVTVLDRTVTEPDVDSPLTLEVRATIDRSIENATAGGAEPPYADYTAIDPRRRPQVYQGIFGAGGELPSFGDLVAAARNMLAGGTGRRRYYAGVDFQREYRRFPWLQTVRQQIERDYPDAGALTLEPAADRPDPSGTVLTLHSPSMYGGLFAGNLFAQSLADALGWDVRTFPRGGLEPHAEPSSLAISYRAEALDTRAFPELADVAMVTDAALLETLPERNTVVDGGVVIVGAATTPADLFRSLTPRTARWLRDRRLRLRTVDAQGIAAESAERPSYVDQLSVWALLGACLAGADDIDSEGRERLTAHLAGRLEQLFGARAIVADITAAMQGGANRVAEIDWNGIGDDDIAPAREKEAPWTVTHTGAPDTGAFDRARFWRSVGYLYENGQQAESLPDPALAAGIVPARTSAFRDMTPFRLRLPRWFPENCTGCGLCWAMCPDSALPPSVYRLSDVVQSALSACEEAGENVIQLRRVAEHIAKQAYRLVSGDEMKRFTTMGPLLGEAFENLMAKMEMPEDNAAALAAEFDAMRARVEVLPVSRTEMFFERPHQEEKGSGAILTIAVDPASCKACGLCAAVCPDDAFELHEQTPDTVEAARVGWRASIALPPAGADAAAAYVREGEFETEVNRLLDRDAYYAMVGGDGAHPGTMAKTAVHLVTATVESVMRPRFAAHRARLDRLIEALEARIQGKVTGALEINDFESFGERITRVERDGVTPEQLAGLTDGGGRQVDAALLARMSKVLGELKQQRLHYAEDTGEGVRARMLMTIDGAGVSRWSGTYPYNPHTSPWISHLPGDAPAMSWALHEGAAMRVAKDMKVCRMADLLAQDKWSPKEHEAFFEAFGPDELDTEERALIPPVLSVVDADSARWDEVERVLSGPHPVNVLILTGDVPGAAGFDGSERAADPALLAALGTDAFVLNASVGHPGHLIAGAAAGIVHPGPSLFHVFATDPVAHGVAPEAVGRQSRLAADSRAHPLFRRDRNGITVAGNPDTGADWPVQSLTFWDASGMESTLEVPVTPGEWAAGEARFEAQFRYVGKGHLSDRTKPLHEYIELGADEREGYEPFVHVVGEDQRHLIAIVSREIVDIAEKARDGWRDLRSREGAEQPRSTARATTESAEPATPTPSAAPAASTGAGVDGDAHQALTERLLWLCGYGQDPAFFKRSLREFLAARQTGGADNGPADAGER